MSKEEKAPDPATRPDNHWLDKIVREKRPGCFVTADENNDQSQPSN